MAKLSVCVPAYNAEKTLEATLRSVLSQDGDFEVILLNNASDDRTEEIARSFHDSRFRVFTNDSFLDIGANWNKVVSLSTGELVKILCADDLLMPGSIEAQIEIMWDGEVSLILSRYDVIDAEGVLLEEQLGIPKLVGMRPSYEVVRAIIRLGPAGFGPTAAGMFRREHFDRVGGFRGDLVCPMDVDLFARVAVFGMFFGMAESGAAYRVSKFNVSSQTSTLSKLAESARHHHGLARDYPEIVRLSDLFVGDFRLVQTAFRRLWIRGQLTAERIRRELGNGPGQG